MDSARQLFEELVRFKQDDGSGITPEDRLIQYCRVNLAGIERLHIDFKEKHDTRIAEAHVDDKRNLAKAASGFANSSGGVLVWGFENTTIKPKPITDIEKFVGWAMDWMPKVVDPRVSEIDGNWIPSTNEPGKGYGLILIPESGFPPHRAIFTDEKIKDRYFVRTGSDFVVATHAQLEDMFGRRPQARLTLETSTSREGDHYLVRFTLLNRGRATAKWPMAIIEVPEWKFLQVSHGGTSGRQTIEDNSGGVYLRALVLKPVPDFVLHPTLGLNFTGWYVEAIEGIMGKTYTFRCQLYAEGSQPVNGTFDVLFPF